MVSVESFFMSRPGLVRSAWLDHLTEQKWWVKIHEEGCFLVMTSLLGLVLGILGVHVFASLRKLKGRTYS